MTAGARGPGGGGRGAERVFAGPGEMAARGRALDWAATPLGPVEGWSPALRAAARLVVASPASMSLWCGPGYTVVYNDAYRRVLGAKHPAALGRPGAEVWAEIWPEIGPLFDQVRGGGAPVAAERVRFVVARRDGGGEEEGWFDYALSPVHDDDGAVVAVLSVAADTTSRERAVRALAGEQAALAQLLDGAPAVMAVYSGPDHVITYVNPAWERIVGKPGALGRPFRDAFPEMAATGILERLTQVYETGEPYTVTELPLPIQRQPGGPVEESYWDFVWQPQPGPDGDGGPSGRGADIRVHALDVTAQVRARREVERLLAESERARADAEAARAAADLARGRLEALLAHLPVGVTLAEAPSGRLLVSNAAVEHIWGLDTPAARVADYSALYVGFRPGPGPEAGRRYASDEWPLARALATGEAVMDEVIEILRPDGTRVMASVSAAPVRDAGGAVVGGIVMTQDVTERERLLAGERAARERTERLQLLTAALARARTIDDVADVVVAEMVAALAARTGALAVRDADADALVLLRTVGFPEPVEAGVRRQSLDFRSPLTECYRTQAPVWIETREGPAGLDARYPPIAPVWDALGVASAVFVPLVVAGETVGVISFAFAEPRPFTPTERTFFAVLGQQAALAVERARLFEAEREARTEAEAANQAKSQFLAVMSHELRTPLNAIGGYAELMEMGIRGPITPQQREDLRRVQASQRHLLGLINEVLNYAKLETGAVQYDVVAVRARDAVAGAEALVAPQALAKGLTLVVEECPADVAASADVEKLRQILVNLVSNAVKFTDRGGRIALACATRGDRVELTVRDTGIGIAADQLARIFDPFVQVRSDLTRTAEGTGLGLAISRDLARGMGGDLTVESTPGFGSTFTLTLPRAPLPGVAVDPPAARRAD